MNKYTIVKNDYLKKDIIAYNRCDYLGYNKPNNPDYINLLKNTFNNEALSNLNNAKNELRHTLRNELIEIISAIPDREIVICIVPRAKSENSYSQNQLQFKATCRNIIRSLRIPGKFIIDGSSFITRHTDTCTTHLARSPIGGGNGPMPYVGITKDTCHISTGIINRHILLIDDIYTKNVNIDEDVIQCLLDNGAKDVTFFSIARTPHYSFEDIYEGEITFARRSR